MSCVSAAAAAARWSAPIQLRLSPVRPTDRPSVDRRVARLTASTAPRHGILRVTWNETSRLLVGFTERCYAEHGIATASRPSVCLSVTLRYCDHIRLEYFGNSRLIRIGCLFSAETTSRIYSKWNIPNY